MILIFGGTTEGRQAVAVCEESGNFFYYSTKGNTQQIDLVNGKHVCGEMDFNAMIAFCVEKDIRLIIDAAHPFAENLHRNIATVSASQDIPVIRYERIYLKRDDKIYWADSFKEALAYLENSNITHLLALTGVNTISKLKPYWKKHSCIFRIMNRAESYKLVEKVGFPKKNIIYYQQGEGEKELFHNINPQAIILKESGETGGFEEKVKAAQELNIPVIVIKRLVLSSTFKTVDGRHGLRKQIETVLPDFFELKTGFTTGSCATAATKAALIALLTKNISTEINIELPDSETVYLPIHDIFLSEEYATASVIKEAGDDPDVTNGVEIKSTVKINPTISGVRFLPGEGVGIITLPGLGIEIGEPAINKTPRMMIEKEIKKLLFELKDNLPVKNYKLGVEITISVPQGKEIAQKTFNPKLGITGGISIIGTSGIVKPFSSDAFLGSIRREMEVAKALGYSYLVINSGAKSEKYLKNLFPSFPSQAFIHYGNFIGETLSFASELGFSNITMGIMIGKAIKLAEGYLDTHSRKNVMNKEFIKKVAEEAGCKKSTIEKIESISLSRQLREIIPKEEN
ncbi:MAG: cobalt-precorrin-5B (C(1))-methyltransferase CbiD, partial [Odoribacter sp.]|nr:cobalt-precorrin-5B (C(1))-methyltransferase CbiD [Odoribacter sp.]